MSGKAGNGKGRDMRSRELIVYGPFQDGLLGRVENLAAEYEAACREEESGWETRLAEMLWRPGISNGEKETMGGGEP